MALNSNVHRLMWVDLHELHYTTTLRYPEQ